MITGASIEAKTSGSGEDIEMKLKRARFVADSDDEDGAGCLSLLGGLEDPEGEVHPEAFFRTPREVCADIEKNIVQGT